jgi:hypothetical protein
MFGRELSRMEHDALYKKHVEAGTSISAQNVSTHSFYLTTLRVFCSLTPFALP